MTNDKADLEPAPESPSKRPSKRSRWRWLRRLLVFLLLSPLLFLIAVNLALNLGVLSPVLNKKPEKTRVRWDVAWTVWPTTLHVLGLSVRGQSPRQQWYLSLRTARLDIDPELLFERQFHVYRLQGEGLSYRQRRRLDAPGKDGPSVLAIVMEDDDDPTTLAPSIPGLANPPELKPEELYPPPSADRPPGWRIDIEAIDVGTEELWLESYRHAGDGRLTGRMRYQVRGDLEIPEARLELSTGAVWVGEERIAEGTLTATARSDPFRPPEHRGTDLLRVVEGRVVVEGSTQDLAFLRYYLQRVPWVSLNGGGQLRADLRLDRGILQPGSTLDLQAGDIHADYLLYRSRGDGSIRGRVEEGEDGPQLEILAELDSFHVSRRQQPGHPFIRGDGLRLRVASDETDLLVPLPRLTAEITLPESELPDLTTYNIYLPPDVGVQLTGGSGRISAHMRIDTATGDGRGEMRLRARNAGLQINRLQMFGDLDFHSRIGTSNLQQTEFDLAGTSLRLDNATLQDDDGDVVQRGWFAEIDLPRAEMKLSQEGSESLTGRFSAEVRARLLDSRPLLALAETGSLELPSWAQSLLTVQNVVAHAELHLDAGALDIHRLRVTGSRRLEIRSELRLRPDGRDVLLFLNYGPLSGAAELHGDEHEWKLRGAEAWFQQRELLFLEGESGLTLPEP